MARFLSPARTAGAGLLACCLLAGCGDGPPKVSQTGKLLRDGRPLQYDPLRGDRLEIGFLDAEQLKNSAVVEPYDVDVRPDGSFEVGADRGGIPVGHYKLVLHLWKYDKQTKELVDVFGNRFSRRNSQVILNVTGDELIIDVEELLREPAQNR